MNHYLNSKKFFSRLLSLINILKPLFGENEMVNTPVLFPGSFILSQQFNTQTN